jgi:hypothetical protein
MREVVRGQRGTRHVAGRWTRAQTERSTRARPAGTRVDHIAIMAFVSVAVIVSANSHLRTASRGAEETARRRERRLQTHRGPRRVIQAITVRYVNGQRIRATPEIVYRAARSLLSRF